MLSLCLILLSCRDGINQRYNSELTAFMGTKIDVPFDSMLYMGVGGESFHRSKWMYVVYTDSASCSDCAVNHFSDWADIDMLSYVERGLLSYVFVVSPPKRLRERIVGKISQDSLFRPFVFVDTANCFNRHNPSLPRHGLMHTFMVDDSSSVVLVGNPTVNGQVKGLMQKVLESENTDL